MKIKLYIDDVRQAPEGWVQAYTERAAVKKFLTGDVSHVSFDHDLGMMPKSETIAGYGVKLSADTIVEGSGYEVIKWLEEKIAMDDNFPVPHMTVHSDNGPGIMNIKLAIQSIDRIASRRRGD